MPRPHHELWDSRKLIRFGNNQLQYLKRTANIKNQEKCVNAKRVSDSRAATNRPVVSWPNRTSESTTTATVQKRVNPKLSRSSLNV